jgi:hypothetical protein
VKKALCGLMAAVVLTGCASAGMGGAPGAQSGRASQSATNLQTETIAPGVASALFPGPL